MTVVHVRYLSLILLSFKVFSLCQTSTAEPIITEETDVIRKHVFYPPLNNSHDLEPLVFGLIMSFGGYFDTSGTVPGVRVALDAINNDPSLLPGYSLHYALSDSQCTTEGAVDALFKQLPYSKPKRIALIGGGCSVASESIAEISQHFNLMQISCATSTPALSNRNRYPYYFQLVPSMIEFAPLYLSIIKEFNWRHVVIFTQDENLFTLTVDKLKFLLKRENITYAIDLFYSTTGLASLNREPFSNKDERIYLIISYPPFARQLLCEAYHRNIRYPTHLLLTFQWYSPQWWLVEDQNYTCTGEQRGEVLHMTLSVDVFNTATSQNTDNHKRSDHDASFKPSIGITEDEYYSEERKHLNKPPFYFNQSGSAPTCYDATWALALSLNNTINDVDLNNNLSSDEYMNKTVTKKIIEHMNFSFDGLTGNVHFDNDGIRKANQLQVFQYTKKTIESERREINVREIGRVVSENGKYVLHYLQNENSDTVWPNQQKPYDGVPIEVIDTIPLPLVVTGVLLAAVGIIFATICMIFNILFRKKRLIQISRPLLNFFILFGAVLFSFCIIFFIVPTTDASNFFHVVNARIWLISLGLTFCYGTIIMKMFRVYYILHNPSPKKNIQDWALVFGIMALATFDFVVLFSNIIASEVFGLVTIELVPNKDNPRSFAGELQISTDHMIYTYTSSYYQVTVGLLIAYKTIIQLVALLFALCTNGVKVQGLDDAKSIITAIYITTIVLIIFAMIYYIFSEHLITYATSIIFLIFLSNTLILGVVFVPKMIALYKDPKGEKVFDKYETPSFKSQLQHTRQQQNTDSAA